VYETRRGDDGAIFEGASVEDAASRSQAGKQVLILVPKWMITVAYHGGALKIASLTLSAAWCQRDMVSRILHLLTVP
jgi:hypothetical protein